MSIRSGAQARVVIGVEDSFNAGAAAPKGHVLPFASARVGRNDGEQVDSEEILSSPDPGLGFADLPTGGGSIVQAMECDSMAIMFYLFLTDRSVAGASAPYTWTFKPGSTPPPSLWAELGYTDVAKYDQAFGLLLSGFSIRTLEKRGGLMTVEWGLFGSGKVDEDQATPYDAAPATYTGRRLNRKDAIVEIDGGATTIVTSIDELSVSRDMQPLHALDGSEIASDVGIAGLANRLSISGWWDDASTLRTLRDGSTHSFAVKIPNPADPTRYVKITFPECLITVTQALGPQDRGPIKAAVSAKPGYRSNASGASLVVEVACDIADIAAIL